MKEMASISHFTFALAIPKATSKQGIHMGMGFNMYILGGEDGHTRGNPS
ncbi:MAG: hypothetical protein IBX64_12610 [Actinobacteria bacterium]|nr:hypothetical protein [Actinomycetota bacterium]